LVTNVRLLADDDVGSVEELAAKLHNEAKVI